MPIKYNPDTNEGIRFDPDKKSWIKSPVRSNPDTGEVIVYDGTKWEKWQDAAASNAKTEAAGGKTWMDTAKGIFEAVPKAVQSGATANFGDELNAAGVAGVRTLTNKLGIGDTGESYGQIYERLKGQFGKREKDLAEQHPVANVAGQVLGGVMAPLPVITKAPGLIGGAVRGLVAPAATGAAAGAGAGETAEERVQGAGEGFMLGGLLGAGTTAVSKTVLPLLGSAARTLGALHPPAESHVLRALQREGIDHPDKALTAVRELQQKGNGAPAALVDVGTNTQRLGREVEVRPGAGSAHMQDTLSSRTAEARDRIPQLISKEVSGDDFYGNIERLTQKRSNEAKPLYAKAYAQGPIHDDRIGEMLRDPIARQGLKQGFEVQRIESVARGEKFDPTDLAIVNFDEAGAPVMDKVPNMRTLDAVKRGLDDILETYRDKTTGRLKLDSKGRAVDEFRRSLLSRVDDYNPDYKAARAAYAGPSEAMESANAGRDFRQGDWEQVASRFQGLSPEQQGYYRMGVARELQEMARKANGDLADVGRNLRAQGVRNRLETILGPDEYKRLMDGLEVERRMHRSHTIANTGSPTGRIDAERDDAGTLRNLYDIVTLRPGSAIAAILARTAGGDKRGLGEAAAEQVGKMLTASGSQELADVGKRLSDAHMRELVNAGMRRASQAGFPKGAASGLLGNAKVDEDEYKRKKGLLK